jgi:hypothetical protein
MVEERQKIIKGLNEGFPTLSLNANAPVNGPKRVTGK